MYMYNWYLLKGWQILQSSLDIVQYVTAWYVCYTDNLWLAQNNPIQMEVTDSANELVKLSQLFQLNYPNVKHLPNSS